MLHYIIGCVTFLFAFFLLQYCTDRPSLWDNYDDSMAVSEPRIDFASCDSYRQPEHQKAIYKVLSIYHDYHSKLAALTGWQLSDTSRIVPFFVALLLFVWFHSRQFPTVFHSMIVRVLLGIAICALLIAISNFVYKLTPFHFQKVDLTLKHIKNDFENNRWAIFKSGYSLDPSSCSELLEDCPLLPGDFSSFSLFAFSYRLAYMNSVYDSVLVRRSISVAVDLIGALAYFFLLPHRIF